MGDLNTPPLSGSIDKMIEAALQSCHIGMPARVISYDASQQRASVQPIIRRSVEAEDGSRESEKIPAIEGVPVKFQGAGSYGATFPISEGDIVWLDFGEGSLDKWLSTGAADVDPDDDRRNALSDAVATPGIRSFKNPTDQVADAYVVYGPMILIGSKDATEAMLLGDALVTNLETLADAVNAALVALNAAIATSGPFTDGGTVASATSSLIGAFTSAVLPAFKAGNVTSKSLKVKVE